MQRRREQGRVHPLIEENLDAIRALAREYGVVRLEVFGSVATGAFDEAGSDVDFLVEYPPNYAFGLWLTRYFELKERLEALLGRSVDLVMVGALRNPYFIQSVNETRQLLYAARGVIRGGCSETSTRRSRSSSTTRPGPPSTRSWPIAECASSSNTTS